MKKYNNHGIRILRPNTPEPTNPTRTELARLQRERDLQRIEYFVRGISERVQPKSPAEAAIVREMALATWKLKGTDMAASCPAKPRACSRHSSGRPTTITWLRYAN